MRLSVRVDGVEEALTKLNAETVQQEMDGALGDAAQDLATPKGGGIGVQVNSLSYAVSSGMAVVESTLVRPRTTGESWMARSEQEFEVIGARVLEAAGERIAAEMA